MSETTDVQFFPAMLPGTPVGETYGWFVKTRATGAVILGGMYWRDDAWYVQDHRNEWVPYRTYQAAAERLAGFHFLARGLDAPALRFGAAPF